MVKLRTAVYNPSNGSKLGNLENSVRPLKYVLFFQFEIVLQSNIQIIPTDVYFLNFVFIGIIQTANNTTCHNCPTFIRKSVYISLCMASY